ncbi:transmembrane protein, putative (macronuclear) [Tetrahymena thermophila SB210]|uniref:Transmembrane protein, putative n=1 Tax=Tetrahymena thermophila (strain SB210) TaxID=312017 RepID=W7XFY8_TETTS|nr:transmembrane protein, putative [Tetrahymena thermophila SB210]EWS72966.1 transmembrane protein, putative [Tetrahymena thermophila SB210]|eukprot:XP_012654499.1 transmembrane protein, putative [Tetrahymena thermophila SB210]
MLPPRMILAFIYKIIHFLEVTLGSLMLIDRERSTIKLKESNNKIIKKIKTIQSQMLIISINPNMRKMRKKKSMRQLSAQIDFQLIILSLPNLQRQNLILNIEQQINKHSNQNINFIYTFNNILISM